MSKKSFTYNTKKIITGIVVGEALFWILLSAILYLTGFYGSATSDHIDFLNRPALWLLLGLIPIVLIYLYNIHKANQLFFTSSEKVRVHLFQPVSSIHSFIKFYLFRTAYSFLILAMAQPAFGSKKVSGTVESLELIICLDISNSMNVKDIDPEFSRLDIAKRAISEMINKMHGEKIGISVFANSAFPQLPLTMDYYAAKMYVNDIQSGMISSQGTNIKAALETSVAMFSKDEKITKGIILVTDGENHEESPNEILAEIKEKNIQFVVLGLGTRNGGLVPKNPDRPELGYKSTSFGTKVMSKLNPRFLSEIAQKGGGFSTISDDSFPNLSELMKQINHMKRSKIDSMEFNVKENKYRIPLFFSILLWTVYFVWTSSFFSKFDKLILKS